MTAFWILAVPVYLLLCWACFRSICRSDVVLFPHNDDLVLNAFIALIPVVNVLMALILWSMVPAGSGRARGHRLLERMSGVQR